jgi:hypothetical protein
MLKNYKELRETLDPLNPRILESFLPTVLRSRYLGRAVKLGEIPRITRI